MYYSAVAASDDLIALPVSCVNQMFIKKGRFLRNLPSHGFELKAIQLVEKYLEQRAVYYRAAHLKSALAIIS